MSYTNLRRLAEQRIVAIQEEITHLREEEKSLRDELAELDTPPRKSATVPLASTISAAPATFGGMDAEESDQPYAFLKPQKAVVRFLRDNPGPHAGRDIHDALLAGGMVTKAKRTRDAVSTALSRQRGSTIEKLPDGRWQAIPPSASS